MIFIVADLLSLSILADLQDSTNVTNLLLLSGIGNSYIYQTCGTEFFCSWLSRIKTTLKKTCSSTVINREIRTEINQLLFIQNYNGGIEIFILENANYLLKFFLLS
jgi:hypothetical protein